jgi:hypothetical protein
MSARGTVAALLAVGATTTLAACSTLLGYDSLIAAGDEPVDTGVSDGDAGAGYRPQGRPIGEAKPSGKGRTIWLEAKQVVFGTLDAAGKDSSDAWKDVGFDLDSTCTGPAESAGDLGTCKKAPGAAPDVLVDGNSCRDNNFGGRLLQQVKFARLEERTNAALTQGNNTWILALDDLDDGEDDPYVPGRLYKAAHWAGYPTAPPPKFDGTDVRQVTAESVTGGDVNAPKTRFTRGYLSKNVWVSGEPAGLDLVMPFDSMNVIMPLTAAVLTVGISADHKTGSNGTIAGAIPVTLTKPLLDPIARSLAICPGTSFYDGLINMVATLPDVVIKSPTLQDPTMPCDGVSVGIGVVFASMQPVTASVVETPISVDKCKDGG